MSQSAIVAIVLAVLAVVERAALGVVCLQQGQPVLETYLLPTALGAVIIWGLVRGSRLAWRWARILGAILGLFALLCGSYEMGSTEMTMRAGLLLSEGALLLGMSAALSMSGARKHFRMVCPRCGSRRVGAANLAFSEAYCRRCETIW